MNENNPAAVSDPLRRIQGGVKGFLVANGTRLAG